MDFWLIVVQSLSLRCFTLTVRPRGVFARREPWTEFFLLFRRLCVIESAHLKIRLSRELAEALAGLMSLSFCKAGPTLVLTASRNGRTGNFFERFAEQFVLSGMYGQITDRYDADQTLFATQYR